MCLKMKALIYHTVIIFLSFCTDIIQKHLFCSIFNPVPVGLIPN